MALGIISYDGAGGLHLVEGPMESDEFATENPQKKPKSLSSLFKWETRPADTPGSTVEIPTETTTEFTEFLPILCLVFY